MSHRLSIAAISVIAVGALAACSSSGGSLPGAGAAASVGSAPAVGPPAATDAFPAGSTPTAGATVNPANPVSGASHSAAAPPPSSGALNVCSLLSSAQASSLNSVTYSTATPKSPISGYDICTYKNTGKHVNPVDIQDLTVTVISLPGCWAGLQQADGPGKPVSGVGDAAFGASIQLDVEAGNRCLTVAGLTGAELSGNYAPDAAMAKIIIKALH
jgi:hypothetical protein